MKKLMLVLVLFLSTFSFGQNNLSMTPELEPYILSFINEGLARDYNPASDIFSKIDSIVIDSNLKYPYLGYFDKKNKSIHIASFTLVDTLIIRTTVFHEITHAITGMNKHTCRSCSDIMSESHPLTFSIYAKEEEWQKQVDKLFKLIKK